MLNSLWEFKRSVVFFLKFSASRHLKKQFFGTSAYTTATRGARVMTFVKIPSAHLKYFTILANPLTCIQRAHSRMSDVNSHEFANNSARTRNKFLLRSATLLSIAVKERIIRHFDSVLLSRLMPERTVTAKKFSRAASFHYLPE